MKILVVSNTAWDDNNSFGNSFSNIFSGLDNIEIANVYCRKGFPRNNIKGKYFQIDEKRVFKSIFQPTIQTGYEVRQEQVPSENNQGSEKYYNFARLWRFRIFYCIRDFLWALGNWNSKELNDFVEEFQPDIMFQPVYYSTYLNQIAKYMKKKFDIPMVCYISDDNYTLRQFSFSPIYWIERLYKRRYVKKTIDLCDLLYVISDVQKEEYEVIFKKNTKVLTKCMDFIGEAPIKQCVNQPIKIVYTGNIDRERGKTICKVIKGIDKVNNDKINVCLDIYTKSPLKKSMLKKMSGRGIEFKGGVDVSEMEKIQSEADVLLLAEAMTKKGAMAVHQSFSTKIVDYMWRARCIWAVGHQECGAIDYFLKYDVGMVARTQHEIDACLKRLVDSTEEEHKELAREVWKAGSIRHQRQTMQKELMEVLEKSIRDY